MRSGRASTCTPVSWCRPASATGSSACVATRCAPPVTDERLRLGADGRVVLALRHPWADGTTDVVFEPTTFLELLAVLVPRPRVNLVLYHCVLAPRAAWRGEVVRRQSDGVDDGSDVVGVGRGVPDPYAVIWLI